MSASFVIRHLARHCFVGLRTIPITLDLTIPADSAAIENGGVAVERFSFIHAFDRLTQVIVLHSNMFWKQEVLYEPIQQNTQEN
ncbi:hypothetical protein KKH15_01030 [Patescibacteria group bacterium]|nr:hypothetical protein [Patescibacteria group bacterium]MBU1754736.1 hypothetical protein [Patescibacteria group bacterium]